MGERLERHGKAEDGLMAAVVGKGSTLFGRRAIGGAPVLLAAGTSR